MIPAPNLERAEAYIHLHLTRLGRAHAAPSALPFVTLSRESGAGATTLARMLAYELNSSLGPGDPPWTLFDGNLVEAMLETHHYPAALARYLPEDAVSEIDASVGELIGLHPSLWELTQKTNELIRQLARLGHCILIGRGSNFATAGLPNGTHLRLIASPEQRAQHLADARHLPLDQAREQMVHADASRRRYVQRTFGRAIDDPLAYDLVVNTDRVPLVQIATWLAQRLRAAEPCPAE